MKWIKMLRLHSQTCFPPVGDVNIVSDGASNSSFWLQNLHKLDFHPKLQRNCCILSKENANQRVFPPTTVMQLLFIKINSCRESGQTSNQQKRCWKRDDCLHVRKIMLSSLHTYLLLQFCVSPLKWKLDWQISHKQVYLPSLFPFNFVAFCFSPHTNFSTSAIRTNISKHTYLHYY